LIRELLLGNTVAIHSAAVTLLQYFGPLVPRADSLEKTLLLEKTEGRRRG